MPTLWSKTEIQSYGCDRNKVGRVKLNNLCHDVLVWSFGKCLKQNRIAALWQQCAAYSSFLLGGRPLFSDFLVNSSSSRENLTNSFNRKGTFRCSCRTLFTFTLTTFYLHSINCSRSTTQDALLLHTVGTLPGRKRSPHADGSESVAATT